MWVLVQCITVLFGRFGISFEFRETRVLLFMAQSNTSRCLCIHVPVSFISFFLYRTLCLLACTQLQCLDVIQWWILGTFYTVFLLHTCVIVVYFGISTARVQFLHAYKRAHTRAPASQPARPTDHIHAWCASFFELWIPIPFLSIYVIFVSEIEIDDLDGCEFRKVQVSVGTRIIDKSCMLVRSNLYVHFRSSQLNHTDSEWNAVFAFQSRNVHSFIHETQSIPLFLFSVVCHNSGVLTLYTSLPLLIPFTFHLPLSSSPFSLSISVYSARHAFNLYVPFSVKA